MTQRHQARLEQLLDRKTREITGLARRAKRWAWGSATLDLDDFVQEGYSVAIEIFRRHSKTKNDDDLEKMMHKGIVYHLWGEWRKEVTHLVHTVELTTEHVDPLSDEFRESFIDNFMQEARAILSDFHFEMLEVLIRPEHDVTSQLCYDLFKFVEHRPIQRGEFFYLSLYFNLSVADVQSHFYDLRARIAPLLENAA